MHADFPIQGERTRPYECCKLARRPPAGEVHLEEPVLGVDETGRARDVFASAAAYGGNAEPVARDLAPDR